MVVMEANEEVASGGGAVDKLAGRLKVLAVGGDEAIATVRVVVEEDQ